MSGPHGRGPLDVWNSGWKDLGPNVKGGSVDIHTGHTTVYGEGWHRSWDVGSGGKVSDDHATFHDSGDKVNLG
jgi:hypothetical protein